MIVMGLDIATHVGLAVWCEGVIVHKETIYFPPVESAEPKKGGKGFKAVKANHPLRFKRYEQYATALEDSMTQWAVTHVFVEGYGYANKFTLVPLVELGTILRSVLCDSGLPWREVPPPTVKKFLTGSGSAKKDMMLLEVYKRFATSCTTDDEADAVTLAYFGAATLGASVPLPQSAINLALALDKPK